MTSKTETAIAGLVAALTAAAGPSTFPVPVRNEGLNTAMLPFAGGAASMNIWDGDGGPAETMAGADVSDAIEGYDLEQRPQIEWMVEGGSSAQREATFDAGLVAIDNVLRTDRTLGGALGVNGWAAIERIERAGSGLTTDGLPNIKSAIVTVLLTFTSSRPF